MAKLAATASRRPKWHWIYYALAAIDLLTIGGSLYLNHQITNIYAESIELNHAWAGRLESLIVLNGLAQRANAPGNDVFDSHDVTLERARRDIALSGFWRSIQTVEAEVRQGVEESRRPPLLASLDTVRQSMVSMNAEADRIFAHFEVGESDLAGRRMATMDRLYGEVTSSITRTISAVQVIHEEGLMDQRSSLERVVATPSSSLAMGDHAQLVVEEGKQLVYRRRIAVRQLR